MSRGGVAASNYVLHVPRDWDEKPFVALCGRKGGNFFGSEAEVKHAIEGGDECCKNCQARLV